MTQSYDGVAISFDARRIRLTFDDGVIHEFASIWLRDNQPGDRDQHSGQRLIDVVDLPDDPQIRDAAVVGNALSVRWGDTVDPARYELSWLRAHAPGGHLDTWSPRRWLEGAQCSPATDFSWIDGAAMRSDRQAAAEWMRRLVVDGIAFMRDIAATDEGIIDAMAEVGQIARTNYGLVYDVRTVAQPENLAYSDLGLGLHTDNPYREPVPGFQALHVLVAAPDGGDSLFVDGHALAAYLRETQPEHFSVLTGTAVPFRYRAQGTDLRARRPLIQLDCEGGIAAVHYNSRSIAPLSLSAGECERFYRAYRAFAHLLREPRFQLRLHLGDRDLVVFDNQRVLHGRTRFESARHPRHLRGCYLTRDSVTSNARLRSRD